jgi:cytochrome c-type biogenesis protein CcmF
MIGYLPSPPALGIAVGLLGKALVFFAIAAFICSAAAWVAKRNRIGAAMFAVGAVAVVTTFGTHVALLLSRQYEYEYVFHNSQNEMPGIYRLSAAWAAQEGSFLLWVVTSSVIAALVARKTREDRRWFSIVASLAIIGMLAIIAYESPFKLISLTGQDAALLAPGQTHVLPPDGRGLNPTLMNYWMAIHPWVIFFGFGSLLSLFSWAAAAAIRRSGEWVSYVRPLAITSATILGVGLTMGGLWAYETLGWGGFWAWDPVENVSLVPFLATTVLVHGLYVQANRGRWTALNIVLGMLPFLWFAYGTYLTRSGALVQVSVHSFAEMNAGAHGWLLGLVVTSAIVFVCLSIRAFWRSPIANARPVGQRQIGMSLGMFFLYAIALMAAYGMSMPFFGALLGRAKEVVGESDYNRVVAWPFIPALLAMACVPFIGWTKTAPERWNRLANAFFVSVLLFGITTFILVKTGLTLDNFQRMPAGPLSIFFALTFVCLFGIVANGLRLFERVRARTGKTGAFVTHTGVCLLLLGLIVSRAFEKTNVSGVTLTQPARIELSPGQSYIAMLEKLPTEKELLEPDNRLSFSLVNDSTGAKTLVAPNYYYSTREGDAALISRPDIVRRPLYDLYFVAGSPETTIESNLKIKKGEVIDYKGLKIRYIDRFRVGEPGIAGTRFGVRLEITYQGKTYKAAPELKLGAKGGPQRQTAEVKELGIGIELESLQATDGSAALSIVTPELVIPVQLFFKPLTSFVWLGLGMMTVGGMLAVLSLSRRKAADAAEDALAQSPKIESSPR